MKFTELSEQLIEAELKNAKLRRENLLMEQQILEAKLAYWKEKRRSYFAGTAVRLDFVYAMYNLRGWMGGRIRCTFDGARCVLG